MKPRSTLQDALALGFFCLVASTCILALRPSPCAAQGGAQRTRVQRVDVQAGNGARQKAVDKAFAAAVANTVAELLSVEQRREHADGLERTINRHARLFVASFRVLSSVEREGRYFVELELRIDVGKLKRAIGTLGIRLSHARPRSDTGVPGEPDATSVSHMGHVKVLVLLHVSSAGKVLATFGTRAGSGGSAGAALSSHVRAAGFEQVAATRGDIPLSRGGAGRLPLSDSAAIALGRQTGAGAVVVVGVVAVTDGPVRATALRGARATSSARAIDVATGEPIGTFRAKGSAVAGDSAAAQTMSAAQVSDRIGAQIASGLRRHWPARVRRMVDRSHSVTVAIRGAASFRNVRALAARLRSVPGVGRVELSQLAARQLSFSLQETSTRGATALSSALLARHLRGVALHDATSSVATEGTGVVVVVTPTIATTPTAAEGGGR